MEKKMRQMRTRKYFRNKMHFVKHESSSAYVKKHMMQDNPNVEYNQSLLSTTSNRTKHTGPYLRVMMLNNVPIIMDIDTGSDVTVISSRQFEKKSMHYPMWDGGSARNGLLRTNAMLDIIESILAGIINITLAGRVTFTLLQTHLQT